MGNLMRDVRYGLVNALRRPGATLVTLAALALGIGGNAAIFSAVHSILLRPLPYEDAGRLVRLHDSNPPQFDQFPVSPGNFTVWRERATSFEQVAAYFPGPPIILSGHDRPEVLEAARVSATLFPMLRVAPMGGRTFTAEEEEQGRDQVALLSHGLWQRRFGARPDIVGQPVTLNDKSYTVVGVMPADFTFPSERTEAWIPLGFKLKDRTRHGSHYLSVLARLKPGTSLGQAQAEMHTLAGTLATTNPETNTGWDAKVVGWQDDLVAPVRRPLLIVAGAVFLVLLIACVNIANVSLAESSSRSREVAIRMALGASRGRVARQLLTESVLLSLLGGGLGLLLAVAGVRGLTSLAGDALPQSDTISMDWSVLAFTMVLSLLTGIAVGLAPAFQASGSDVNDVLKEGGRAMTDGRRTHRLRMLLVVSEVGLSLVLLVGAGLLIRSFAKLQEVDPGFDSRNVLAMDISLNRTRYPTDSKQAELFERVVQSISEVPGIQSAAAVNPVPLVGGMNYGFAFGGQAPAPASALPTADYHIAGPDYFKAMRIPLLRGRTFTHQDRDDAPRVAIINESMARAYFGRENPVGKQIFITNGSDVWREIVGVVGDAKQQGLDTEARPQMYEPYLQEPFFAMTIVARTGADPVSVMEAAQAAVRTVDKDQPVTGVTTMEAIAADSLARRRFSMTLITVFAGVALVLASAGIYGVMAHMVSQRTHEIGIRTALGAQAADIARLIVGQAALPVALGIGIGVVVSLAVSHTMSTMLYGVTATDWPTFAGVAGLLLAVAMLACYLPARRAMKVDPLEALRRV